MDGQNPFCPVCGCPCRLSELSSHFDLEVERLMEVNKEWFETASCYQINSLSTFYQVEIEERHKFDSVQLCKLATANVSEVCRHKNVLRHTQTCHLCIRGTVSYIAEDLQEFSGENIREAAKGSDETAACLKIFRASYLPEYAIVESSIFNSDVPYGSPMLIVRKDDKGKPESRWEAIAQLDSHQRDVSSRGRSGTIPTRGRRKKPCISCRPGLRKREHQEMDAETSIDSRTAANFNWAVTARLHAIANLHRSLPDFSTRKFEVPEDENQELNVDGDDSATYGQPHYTEADVITCSSEDNADNKGATKKITSKRIWLPKDYPIQINGHSECVSPSEKASKPNKDANGDNPKDQMEDGIKCLHDMY
ncbi:e3 ubiquitin-protein ligase Rnf220, partial [Caerostris extrusa]